MSDVLIIPEGLSKKERKKFKREFYRVQIQKQTRSVQWKKYASLVGICLLILAGGYWLVKEATKPLPGEFIPSLGNKHIQNVTDAHDPYNSVPPTSGTHVGDIARWGISDDPIPDELQLHNLEDGGVMVQYSCAPGQAINTATASAQETDDCKALIEQLAAIVKRYPDKVAMAPYPRLDTRIALTAWTRIDKFNDFDKERVEKFIGAFKGIDHHK